MTSNRLELLSRGPVATVRLQRPEVHNAFDAAVIAELTKTFRELSRDSGVRVVILSGAGENFCAGADINWMRSTVEFTKQQNEKDAQKLHAMLESIYACPKPVIARVQGVAFGGGVGLAAASDIVIAADNAKFSLSEVRLGILPAVISPFVVRKMGTGNLRAYGLSARRFGAQEALRIGLVHEVAALADLDRIVDEWVDLCLQNGPGAMALLKELSPHVGVLPISKASQKTTKTIAKARVSAEGQEGLRAFLEKRSPSWRAQR